MQQRTRNRLALIAIALLFFCPVAIAILMQSKWWQFEPAHSTNRGALVEPAMPLPGDAIDWSKPVAGHWLVLYLAPSACDARCVEDATALSAIYVAAGRRQSFLAVGLLPTLPGARLEAADFGDTDIFAFGETRGDSALRVLSDAARAAGTGDADLTGKVFLVDPAGRVALAYPAGFKPGDINKDLKRLLKGASE
ncbi:hypothetical protein F3N42_06575 [Marinihelvus fidelis]|uniref:Thioredoxin domain-containing protein n=1 Tax=Marinihelvus fidelis TaxID=2613842 RepID=A0A5N0TA78_9GAMM|nr:hypothetical protein [Marinihelvus fidelis]KAA9131840.1 hypothetical protein F3N42_06575 [Marinihelvus fidelis]